MAKTTEELEQIIVELQEKVKVLEDRVGIGQPSGSTSDFYDSRALGGDPPSHEARLKNLEKKLATGMDVFP
jgi:hypothetical protein